ncbi:MAG TPA: glycosyl hydrolase family 8 [Polyangiaceae bacterium]|nr:glycosyl hydrolase family 8 [Polyangiaceae bacterium]
MWNRFLLNPGLYRAQIVGASLTLMFPAILAMSCSSDPTTPVGSAGSGNALGSGGAKATGGTGGAAAPCTTMCGGVCTDLATSSLNCGMCGKACAAPTPFCVAAACSSNCPTTTTACNGQCVDTSTSPTNCGMCGKACAANEACTNSICVAIPTGGAGAGGSSGGGTIGSGGSAGAPVAPPGRNGCLVKPGLISDFEEGATATPAVVIASEGRTGTWEIFNDKSKTTQTIKVEPSGGTADCNKFALHVTGSGYNEYVGFGMNFAGTPEAPTVYDAAAKQFTGIRFKAKAGTGADPKSPVRLNISIPATEDKANPGGACTATAESANKAELPCYQHLGKFIPPGTGEGQLGSAFKTYTYCFDRDLYPLSLPSNVSNAQRNALSANLLKLQFQFNQGKDYSGAYPKTGGYPPFQMTLPFDIWVDDVEFITGPCSNATPSPSNGSPAKPFPQNAGVGTCMPATNAANFSSAIAQIYANWTKTFVQDKKIVAPEQDNAVTSEAMGYGMMIAAAMGDKAAFDKFDSYVVTRLNGGLMTWKENEQGSASDGDLDLAYAYLMASLQWPSGDYKAKSDAMADAIVSKDLEGGVVTGGSNFKQAPYNASYFSPGWMRKLKGLSGAIAVNYTLVNANITGTTSGIPTDWASKTNGAPSGPGSAQVTSDIQDASGAMGYDAARVPWRLGMDACLGGGNTTGLKAIVDFFAAKYDAGATIDLMKAGWIKGSGAVHPKAINMQGSYIGPMGVGGMAMNNAAMKDRAFRAMLDLLESGDYNHTYFPSTVGLLTLLAMSGNFPTP